MAGPGGETDELSRKRQLYLLFVALFELYHLERFVRISLPNGEELTTELVWTRGLANAALDTVEALIHRGGVDRALFVALREEFPDPASGARINEVAASWGFALPSAHQPTGPRAWAWWARRRLLPVALGLMSLWCGVAWLNRPELDVWIDYEGRDARGVAPNRAALTCRAQALDPDAQINPILEWYRPDGRPLDKTDERDKADQAQAHGAAGASTLNHKTVDARESGVWACRASATRSPAWMGLWMGRRQMARVLVGPPLATPKLAGDRTQPVKKGANAECGLVDSSVPDRATVSWTWSRSQQLGKTQSERGDEQAGSGDEEALHVASFNGDLGSRLYTPQPGVWRCEATFSLDGLRSETVSAERTRSCLVALRAKTGGRLSDAPAGTLASKSGGANELCDNPLALRSDGDDADIALVVSFKTWEYREWRRSATLGSDAIPALSNSEPAHEAVSLSALSRAQRQWTWQMDQQQLDAVCTAIFTACDKLQPIVPKGPT